MLVKSYAAAVQGISATVVTVEVNCSKGIQFFLVGLPDVAVRESHERIISALQAVSYRHIRAHETPEHVVCRLLLAKKNKSMRRTVICWRIE